MAAMSEHDDDYENGYDSNEEDVFSQTEHLSLSDPILDATSTNPPNSNSARSSFEDQHLPSAVSLIYATESSRTSSSTDISLKTSTESAASQLIHDLQTRCLTLLSELETFRSHLRSLNRESTVDTGVLRHSIQSELKSLERASTALTSPPAADGTSPEDRATHLVRSSNLPFLETVWNTAKRNNSIVGFSKRLYWESPPKKDQKPTNGSVRRPTRKYRAVVDIAADAGATWIKVSSISETRLIFEMAGQGWHEDDSFDSEGSGSSDGAENSAADRVSIVRTAENLAAAAKATRVRYRHPKVRFVLPRITPGRYPQVDALLDAVRATGVVLETAATPDVTAPPIPLTAALPNMIQTPFTHFASTLNVDCTILLAIASDLSHTRTVTTEPWFHKAMQRQIEREHAENLLPSVLYPAMGARRLVCTSEAAQRMREIVEIIGTEKERVRTGLLLGDGVENEIQGEERGRVARQRMQTLSEYPVPSEWKIPIEIIDVNNDIPTPNGGEKDSLLSKIAPNLSPINQSIFLYGWRMGYTTITSNRTVAKQIEKLIEAELDSGFVAQDDEEVGPDVWVCLCSRSLIGKEKGRK